ncbi:hypothetical protein V498_08330, partial [Pseudogymnoascus sp. VKM F-4517 (FW-2822)]
MDSETRAVDINALAGAFEAEPLNYEVAWKNLRDLVEKTGAIEHVPALSPELLHIHEVFKLFNLRTTENCMLEDEPGMPIPSYLEDDIARMHSVTNYGRSGNHKALCRIILDQILISAIYEESNKETMEAREDQDLGTRLSHL